MALPRFGLLALLSAAAVIAPAANALQSRATSDEVMNLQADRIQIEDRKLRATFEGRVRAEQGNLTITSDRAVALYSASLLKSDAAPDLTRIEAAGNVVVKRQNETARGNFAVYNLNERVITLIGNVVLNRGANIVRGGRLAIDLDTNSATLGGGNSGGNVGSSPGGRVTGTFSVPKRKATTAPADDGDPDQ